SAPTSTRFAYTTPCQSEPATTREHWPIVHGDLVDDLLHVARESTALAHPQCMGHQVPPPLPGAVLAETVAALLNNGMAVYEMGPIGRAHVLHPVTDQSP